MPACHSLIESWERLRSTTTYLPLGPFWERYIFCAAGFSLYYWFWRHHVFSLSHSLLLHPFMTLFRLLHGTTNAHQPRNLFPLPPFFTPRSARFRATRLVPYLIPSATAMEKQKEAQRAKPADNSETAPHGKGEQGTWVLWRCILTTAFLFLSLFFLLHTLSLFSSLTVFTCRYLEGAAVDDCRLLGSHRRSGSSIQAEKETAGTSQWECPMTPRTCILDSTSCTPV